MKLIIDISKEKYDEIHSLKFIMYGLRSEENKQLFFQLINAVQDGTPLPKRHGRLIDADKIIELAHEDGAYGYVSDKEIADAPTIIEAESER